MKNIFRILSIIWILAGFMLAAWSAREMYESYQYFHFISGAFKASMIGLAYAMTAIAAGVGVSLRKRWGRYLLNAVSVFAVLYFLLFVLFHGYLDRPLPYSVGVVALCIVSVLSLVSMNGKSVKKEYFS